MIKQKQQKKKEKQKKRKRGNTQKNLELQITNPKLDIYRVAILNAKSKKINKTQFM